MEIKITNRTEIDLLVQMRIEFIQELHPEYDEAKINTIRNGSLKYITEHFEKEMYVGFIGESNNQIICTTSLLIYNFPPLYSGENRKIGHVLNFFTRKEYRNCGYGYELMEYVKKYAKKINIYKLDLTATEVGYQLYKKCGFTDSIRTMECEIL